MKDLIVKNDWKIIQDRFIAERNQTSESVFSLGNGRLGGRGNHILLVEGPSLLGNYIAGVYYPDKTKVGWWKNGYPEYFAKVLNSVNWKEVRIAVDGEALVLSEKNVSSYRSELDMRTGILQRSYVINIPNGRQLEIRSSRFYSMDEKDAAFLTCAMTVRGGSANVEVTSSLDFNVMNTDSNYEEPFWDRIGESSSASFGFVYSKTKKTDFHVVAGHSNDFKVNGQALSVDTIVSEALVEHKVKTFLVEDDTMHLTKRVCICSSYYHPIDGLKDICTSKMEQLSALSMDDVISNQRAYWDRLWEGCDIVIDGDVAAQQAIRYNIFQLYQTYTGEDPRLNIGPKGFTGEKYGGVTYWDTEAYCLPFYMSTTDTSVGYNLLKYRYIQLPKAIENAEKLGFKNGAALYPMVTMTGEECHNEWEITFEEIHRNAAIAYAIYDYTRYNDDSNYLKEYGIEVLIAIARFWAQRVNWSSARNQYVMLGVTGPNEYENNVNNNWYTNYAASWCLKYCQQVLEDIQQNDATRYTEIINKTNLKSEEFTHWSHVIDKMYFPYDETREVFLQQDGFLDKELLPAASIPEGEYPIHQHWSWDRILRSCFIKQADVLQGLYFFENDFDKDTIRRNFEFYESMTVHESSLSPCVHSILAAYIGQLDKAYDMYIRTARLDLEDLNHDTKDGLHITSMAGTWMSIVKGFGGMRIRNNQLSFDPILPTSWKGYSFKLKFRSAVIQLKVEKEIISISSDQDVDIMILGDQHHLKANQAYSLEPNYQS